LLNTDTQLFYIIVNKTIVANIAMNGSNVIDNVSEGTSTSHKNELSSVTDIKAAVAKNKVGPSIHNPVFNLVSCNRRSNGGTTNKPNTTMETEKSDEIDDYLSNEDTHRKHIDNDTDDDHDITGASSLISGMSAPSLDGVSIATNAFVPFSHIVHDGGKVSTLEDDMSSMNSSVNGTKSIECSKNDGNYRFKVTSYGKATNDDDIYTPSLQKNSYHTDAYSEDLPKRLITTLVHPQPAAVTSSNSKKEVDSEIYAATSSDALVYEMQEDTVSRSFLSKNTRSERRLRRGGASGRLVGVLGGKPFGIRRRETGSGAVATSFRDLSNNSSSGFVGVPMSPLSGSGVSAYADEEVDAISGADHETESECNSTPTNSGHAQVESHQIQPPLQREYSTRRKAASIAWSEGTSDICSIDDGIFSLADLHSQNDSRNDRSTDGGKESNGLQSMLDRVTLADVAAVREIGSTSYRGPPYDNPSTVVSSDSTPKNTSDEDLTGPNNIPKVVEAFIDVENNKAIKDNGKGKNSHHGIQDSNDRKALCCLPSWLNRSPLVLKLIIIGVLLILLAAVVVAIFQYSIFRSSETNAIATTPQQTTQQNKTNTSKRKSPTSKPTPSAMNSYNNTDFGDDDTVSQNVTGSQVAPSMTPSSTLTMGPTNSFRSEETVLYFVSGPYQYFDDDTVKNRTNTTSLAESSYVANPIALSRIPKNKGKSFMVQLGDWNSPTNSQCSEQTYIDVANYYGNSSVPVYFVLGDNGT
jgi:hypothetical protein